MSDELFPTEDIRRASEGFRAPRKSLQGIDWYRSGASLDPGAGPSRPTRDRALKQLFEIREAYRKTLFEFKREHTGLAHEDDDVINMELDHLEALNHDTLQTIKELDDVKLKRKRDDDKDDEVSGMRGPDTSSDLGSHSE